MRCLILFIINIFLFDQLVHTQPTPKHELDSLRNLFYQKQEALFSLATNVRGQIDTTKDVAFKKKLAREI